MNLQVYLLTLILFFGLFVALYVRAGFKKPIEAVFIFLNVMSGYHFLLAMVLGFFGLIHSNMDYILMLVALVVLFAGLEICREWITKSKKSPHPQTALKRG